MSEAMQLADVDAGEPAVVHLQAGDVSAPFGIPGRPARPEDEPRDRRKGNEFPTLRTVIPVEDADGMVGGLDGDAAGGADGHDLRRLRAGEKQMCLPVGVGGHVLSGRTHVGSFAASYHQMQS